MVQVQGTTTPSTDRYSGVIFGGYTAGVVGSIGLLIIVVVGLTSDHTITAGLIGLSISMVVVGAILAAAGYVVRHIDSHRIEHIAQDSGLHEEIRILRQGKEAADAMVHRAAGIIDNFLAREAVVELQSELARDNIAKLQSDVAALRQVMDKEGAAQPADERLLTATREYLDAQLKALWDRLDKVLKDVYNAGYVKGVDARLNGTGQVRSLPARAQD